MNPHRFNQEGMNGGGLGEGDAYVPYRPSRYMSPIAEEVQHLSIEQWGGRRAVTIVGHSPALVSALEMARRVAAFDEPVLITGESGSGKESFAQSIYLLGARLGKTFISVNCPQYQEGNLTVSELFGHTRGSFTGAVADRKGCFEMADGGTIFLDEVGDLQMPTQVMLLRALSSGEFVPLGSTVTKRSDLRVIGATNRDLRKLSRTGQFREDLFFRLSFFHVEVPPLREREDDWAVLAEHFLRELTARHGVSKSLSSESMRILAAHHWPGNVRELLSIVTTGYAMSEGSLIEPPAFTSRLETHHDATEGIVEELWRSITVEGRDFWSTVHSAFINRDLSRSQVRKIVERGLINSQGSYRKLLEQFQLPYADYQKFMDFLRHHQLKPESAADVEVMNMDRQGRSLRG
jgi:DNA-binding NtrC family response regulator